MEKEKADRERVVDKTHGWKNKIFLWEKKNSKLQLGLCKWSHLWDERSSGCGCGSGDKSFFN